ncbi:ABC transporter permease [Clostridium sp. DL1XJH146]
MRLFDHGIKSLIRRPVKTIMLFSIFFIVFCLMFTGLIIESSIDESKEYIRYEIGAAVEYRMDYDSVMEKGERPPSLSLSVAENIASNSYVKDFFITDSANADSEDLVAVETQESADGFSRNASSFTLYGTNGTIPIDLALEKIDLVDGTLLSEDNIANSDYVVIVSDDLASENNLRVGDLIDLEISQSSSNPMTQNNQKSSQNSTTSTDSSTAEFEIIGIYSSIEDGYSENNMFTSLSVVNELKGTDGEDETTASIIYLLDDPLDVDEFVEEASPYLTSDMHTLYSDNATYEELTQPLDLIAFIASLLIWVVFIAGSLIILAIVTIFVRDRKFEIGLLLSSGEGKMKIVSQFILEILVIAIVAFGISVGASNYASKGVSNWIVENQLLAEDSLASSTSITTTSNVRNMRMPGSSSSSVYGDVDMNSVASEFDVALSADVMGNLLLVSILLVLIGSTIPLSVIMSFNPKKILQD